MWPLLKRNIQHSTNGDDTRGTLRFGDIGFVVGGGAEFALTDRLSLGMQGLYYIFNDKRDGRNLTSDSRPGDFGKIEDAVTITVGASYKF